MKYSNFKGRDEEKGGLTRDLSELREKDFEQGGGEDQPHDAQPEVDARGSEARRAAREQNPGKAGAAARGELQPHAARNEPAAGERELPAVGPVLQVAPWGGA